MFSASELKQKSQNLKKYNVGNKSIKVKEKNTVFQIGDKVKVDGLVQAA